MFLACFLETPQNVAAATSTLVAPSSVKALSSTYNSTDISWNAVTGARGYAVYRAVSSAGTYTYLSSTTALSFKNTGLITGKTYYYKVKSYKKIGTKTIYSNYSTMVSSKPALSAPTTVKASASSYSSILVKWNSVTGATGYSVYRANSNSGTYSFIKNITSTNFNNTGLNGGTTYYYKVKAYQAVSGSKQYGTFSSAKSAATPKMIKQSVNLNKTQDTLTIGASETLTATITPTSDGDDYINWISSDETVATVDDSGTVTAVGLGTVIITAANDDGSVTADCYITVEAKPVKNTDNTNNNNSNNSNTNNGNASNGGSSNSNTNNGSTNNGNTDNGSTNNGNTNSGSANNGSTDNGGSMPVVDNVQIKGIDVSKWQGNIDWTAVKNDGVQFAMLRASYGSSTVDPTFETNYQNAKANGIAVGAYHYSYATTLEKATTEVNFFLSELQGKQFEYPICIDIEDSSQRKVDQETLTQIALLYLDKLSAAGYYPIIYTSKTWFTSVLDDTQLTSYDHWLSQWSSSITYSGAVAIWQYTSNGTVSGINSRVDMNTSYIDYATKIKYLHLNGY